MSEFIENIQYKIKTTSSSILLVIVKLCVGFVIGLTLALIGQQVFGYQTLLFFFVIVTAIGLFFRLSKPWRFVQLFIFTLICVLIGLLLKLYIQIAPGA